MAKLYKMSDNLPDVSRMVDVSLDRRDIPNGFVPIELSTQGLLGAPKLFHIRNFDTVDLVGLALTDDDRLPLTVSQMLESLILEDDVSIRDFHEKEVIETIVRLYKTFYSDQLKDIEFPYTDDDIAYLRKKTPSADEFQTILQDLKQRRWVPRVTVDLNALDTYDLDPATFKREVYLTDKKVGLTVGFSFPRYGDILTLREFMKDAYKEKDKQFSSIKDTLRFRQDAEQRLRSGEDIALSRVAIVPEFERERYMEYETTKQRFGIQAVKALNLVYYDGKDVRDLPLRDRITLVANDARIDYKITKAVNDHFTSMKIGLKEEILMENPIKAVVEERRYSFRLVDLLQAIKLSESSELDIEFEPPQR